MTTLGLLESDFSTFSSPGAMVITTASDADAAVGRTMPSITRELNPDHNTYTSSSMDTLLFNLSQVTNSCCHAKADASSSGSNVRTNLSNKRSFATNEDFENSSTGRKKPRNLWPSPQHVRLGVERSWFSIGVGVLNEPCYPAVLAREEEHNLLVSPKGTVRLGLKSLAPAPMTQTRVVPPSA